METNATRMCALLVGLADVHVLAVDDQPGRPVRVYVETTAGAVGCGACGTRAWVKDRPEVALVDLPAFGRPAVLVWREEEQHPSGPVQRRLGGAGSHVERHQRSGRQAGNHRHDQRTPSAEPDGSHDHRHVERMRKDGLGPSRPVGEHPRQSESADHTEHGQPGVTCRRRRDGPPRRTVAQRQTLRCVSHPLTCRPGWSRP